MALSITGGNGDPASQANTQSPQTSAGSGSAPTAAAKSVQPGTANSLLSGSVGGGGIPLTSTALPVASLDTSTQTASSQTTGTQVKPKHHPNAILLGLVVVLAVMAVVAMWLTQRSAKNTTY